MYTDRHGYNPTKQSTSIKIIMETTQVKNITDTKVIIDTLVQLEKLNVTQAEIKSELHSIAMDMTVVTALNTDCRMEKYFVNECVEIQINLAKTVSNSIQDKVYVFVADEELSKKVQKDGQLSSVGTVNTKVYNDKRYVLSATSQKVYEKFSSIASYYNHLPGDVIGCYVTPAQTELKMDTIIKPERVCEKYDSPIPLETPTEIIIEPVRTYDTSTTEEQQDFSKIHITERDPSYQTHRIKEENVDLVKRKPRKSKPSVKKVTTPQTEQTAKPIKKVEEKKEYSKNKMALPLTDFSLDRWCKIQCEDKGKEHLIKDWVYKASKDRTNAIISIDQSRHNIFFVPLTKFKIRLGGTVVYLPNDIGTNTASDLLYNLHKQELSFLEICKMATVAAVIHLISYQKHKKTSLDMCYEIYTTMCEKIVNSYHQIKGIKHENLDQEFKRYMASQIHVVPYNGSDDKDLLLDLLEMKSEDVVTDLLRHYPPHYTVLYNMTVNPFEITAEDHDSWKLLTQENVSTYLADPILNVLHFNMQYVSLATNATCPSFTTYKPVPTITDCEPGKFEHWFYSRKMPATNEAVYRHLDHVAEKHGSYRSYLVCSTDLFFTEFEKGGLSQALESLSTQDVAGVSQFKALVHLLSTPWVNSGSKFFQDRLAKIAKAPKGDIGKFISHLKSQRTSYKTYHGMLLKQENEPWADYCKMVGSRISLRRTTIKKITGNNHGSDVFDYLSDISYMVGDYVTRTEATARNDIVPTPPPKTTPVTMWDKITTKVSDLVDSATEKLARAFVSKLDKTNTATDIRKTVNNISDKMGLGTDTVSPSISDTIGLGVRTANILVDNIERTAMSVVEGVIKSLYGLLNIEYKAIPLSLDLKSVAMSFFLSRRMSPDDYVGQTMLLINALQGSNLLIMAIDFLTTLAAITWNIGKKVIRETIKYVCESPLCPVCLFKNGAKTTVTAKSGESPAESESEEEQEEMEVKKADIPNPKIKANLDLLNAKLKQRNDEFSAQTEQEVRDFAAPEKAATEDSEPQGWLCWLWSQAESKSVMVCGLIGVALVVMTGATTRLKNFSFSEIAKTIVESSKNIHYMTLAFVALPKIFTIFSAAAIWLKDCITGDNKEATIDQDIKKWLEDTAAILPDIFETACVASPDACIYYQTLYAEAIKIRGKLGDAKPQLAIAFKNAFETFGGMYHSVNAKFRMHQGHNECLHIQFAGEPGTGKTNLPPAVFSRIADIMGEDKNSIPYPLKPDAKYHDNFSNQAFAVVDDMFVSNVDQNIAFYLFLFSGVPTVLPQAALPDKGRVATFKAIVSNTNNPYMELQGVGDMKAIWRRRQLFKVILVEKNQDKWDWTTMSHLRFTYNDNYTDSPRTVKVGEEATTTFENMTFEEMLGFVEFLARQHHLNQEKRIRQHGNYPLYRRMEEMKKNMTEVTKLVAGLTGGANKLVQLNSDIMSDTLRRLQDISDTTLKSQLVISEIQGRMRAKSAATDNVDMAKRILHVVNSKLMPSKGVAKRAWKTLNELLTLDLPIELKDKVTLAITEEPSSWVDAKLTSDEIAVVNHSSDSTRYYFDIPVRKGFSYMYLRGEDSTTTITGSRYSVFLIPDDNPLDDATDMTLINYPDIKYNYKTDMALGTITAISTEDVKDPADIISAFHVMIKAYLMVDTRAFNELIVKGISQRRHNKEAQRYKDQVEQRRGYLRKLFDLASRVTLAVLGAISPILTSFLSLLHNLGALFIFWVTLRMVGSLFVGSEARSAHNDLARMRPVKVRSGGKYNSMVDHISSKVYRLEFEYAGNVYTCQGIGIRGNTFLVPKHVFAYIPKDQPITCTVTDSIIVDAAAPNYFVKSTITLKNSFFGIPNKDAGVLVVHNFRTVSNMSKMFLPKIDHANAKNWLPDQGVMLSRRKTPNHPSIVHTAVVSGLTVSSLAIDTNYKSEDTGKGDMTHSNNTVYVSYSNGNGVINGDSGGAVVVSHGSGSKLLGILGASHETKVTIVPVSAEEMEAALAKVGIEWKMDISQPSFRIGEKPSPELVARFGKAPVVGTAFIPTHIPEKSAYFPTRLTDFLPAPEHPVQPAIISDKDPRWLSQLDEEPDKRHFTTASLEKYANEELPSISYDDDIKPVVLEMIEYFKTVPAIRNLRLWTFHEAINGSDHVGTKGINMTTSPGLPYTQSGLTNTKSKFFEQATDLGSYRPTNLAIIEFKRILANAQNGIFEGELKCVHLKDEIVSLLKIISGKTRTVHSTNVMTLIFERVVSGDFNRVIKEISDGTGEHTVGLNPEGEHWNNVACSGCFLQFVGSWDVKNWDANMPLVAAIATAQVRDALYKYAYASRNEEYPEWATFLMHAIEADCVSTFTQFGNVITYKNKGMLSGHPNTYLVNSMWHSILARMIVRRIIRRNGLTHLLSFTHYSDIVRLKFGGDDVLWFVNPRYAQMLSPEAIAEGYKHYGYTITASDKSANLRFTTIFEAEFLKQGFQIDPHTNKFVVKPSKTIPEALVRWQTKGDTGARDQLVINMLTALRYAAFISEEYYNQLKDQLVEACTATRFQWIPYSYQDMKSWITRQSTLERLQIQALMEAETILGSDND